MNGRLEVGALCHGETELEIREEIRGRQLDADLAKSPSFPCQGTLRPQPLPFCLLLSIHPTKL